MKNKVTDKTKELVIAVDFTQKPLKLRQFQQAWCLKVWSWRLDLAKTLPKPKGLVAKWWRAQTSTWRAAQVQCNRVMSTDSHLTTPLNVYNIHPSVVAGKCSNIFSKLNLHSSEENMLILTTHPFLYPKPQCFTYCDPCFTDTG